MSREPVRIKYWGLFWVTRFEYVLLNGVGWLIALSMCVIGVVLNVLPPFSCLWKPDLAWGVFAYFWWFVIACAVGQAFDVLIVWRKFAKTEEEMDRRQFDHDDDYDDDEPERSEGIMEKGTGYRRRRSRDD